MKKTIQIGNKTIGGGLPILIQSMLNKKPADVSGNIEQAVQLEEAGCDILRVAVPTREAVALIPQIKAAISIPLVADIHFDHRIAIESVEAGADKIRMNPGNIGDEAAVQKLVDCCKAHQVPIRVGVNAGSLEKDLLPLYVGAPADALVKSALRHVRLIEDAGYDHIVLSMKSSSIPVMVEAYRSASKQTEYPLHLGVTEAGTRAFGTLKSAIGIGALLVDGIGDTIRVSLSDDPIFEIGAAKDILKAVGKGSGVEVISCPTCGRTDIDIISIAKEVEQRTRGLKQNLRVAVMGCVVNGPGEARDANIGIAGGKDSAVLFRDGVVIRKISGDLVSELMTEIERYPSS